MLRLHIGIAGERVAARGGLRNMHLRPDAHCAAIPVDLLERPAGRTSCRVFRAILACGGMPATTIFAGTVWCYAEAPVCAVRLGYASELRVEDWDLAALMGEVGRIGRSIPGQ
jgi:hypothetical protein